MALTDAKGLRLQCPFIWMDPDPNPKLINQGLDPVLIYFFFILYCMFKFFQHLLSFQKFISKIRNRVFLWIWILKRYRFRILKFEQISSRNHVLKKIMTEVLIPTCCLSKKFRLLVTNV